MLTRRWVQACVMFIAATGVAFAGQNADRAHEAAGAAEATAKVARASNDVMREWRAHPRGAPPSPALLRAIAAWLADQFALPAIDIDPAVKLVEPARIAAFHYNGIPPDAMQRIAAVPAGQREVVAAYDDAALTIYLPVGWAGKSPAELSVVVHEMVHHIQNVAKLRYACSEAREDIAYTAQSRWLELFGRTLAEEFDVDPFTLLAATLCSS